MFVAVFIAFLLCHQANADSFGVKYRCNDSLIDSDEPYVSFRPSADGIAGRYTVELCALNKPDRTELEMDLTYYDNLKMCDVEYRNRRKRGSFALRPGRVHSSDRTNVSVLTNCKHVCYSMDFDLIFSTCYLLKINSIAPGDFLPIDAYYLINNNITQADFEKTTPHVSFFQYDDYFKLEWLLGIPALDYTVLLHKMNNISGTHFEWTLDVTRNCTQHADVRQVQCTLAPPYGCYHVELQHGGPWILGVFSDKQIRYYDLCHLATPAPHLEPRSGAVWWVCGAALLLAGALAAAVALNHLRLRDLHKRAIENIFNTRATAAPPPAPPRDTRDSRDVLLLYAREGDLGQQAAAALKDLIQHTTGGTVYDIFSPSVMAQCGAAPHTWVRALLARPHTRVLLLQSPALHALYQDQLHDDEQGLRLREPLLGRRALYRTPHFGDQLLKMALRQLAETADAHHAYNKYYLATYAGLESEVLPTLVPYRRYVLPDAARVLAQNLGAAEPCATRLAEASRTAHAFLQHAQQQPDYLMDEIYIN